MRKWPIVLVVLAALGLGWIGPIGEGAAPTAFALSAPRPPATIAVPPVLPSDDPLPELEATVLVEGLDRPTFAVPLGDDRLLVSEKAGVIRLVVDGEILSDPFLDLDAAIPDRRPERGLLAMALHPRFEENGRLYVHLTDLDGDSRLIEYRISEEDENLADPESAKLILAVEEPGEFHNGGMLQFGPEGYLYVALGDGTFAFDVNPNAALKQNLLGSILRIDVDAADPYAVPADNPYVGEGLAPEIWLSGMRNPWRFFIDPVTRQIAIGDVGQFSREEITVVPMDVGGLDLGWPRMEGDECYLAESCVTAGLTMPDVVYSHGLGCAVVVGSIYRGSLIPEMEGMIVYADYCSGLLRAFSLFDGHVFGHVNLLELGTLGPVLSLAVDSDGEILILTELGEIRRLQPIA
jgi:glucose/arabinose dehydrogenase